MALQSAFREKFDGEAMSAEQNGKRAAWVIAIGGAATAGMPLFSQGRSGEKPLRCS
jgi:hypothetical protein